VIRLGNFFFRYRNGLFPLAYLLLFCQSPHLLEDYRIAAVLGVVIAVAGQLLRAVTIGLAYIVRGGKNRQVYAKSLVCEGMFAHCRNPLYLGNFLILAGLGFIANSVLFVVVGIPFFLLAYSAIIAAEENYLRQKFGAEFDAYCAGVPRLLPRLAGLAKTLSGMSFHWQRLVVKEYGSTYVWIAGALLLLLKNQGLAFSNFMAAPASRALLAALVAVTLLYGLARFLKKSALLQSD
jgi:protein-S-isoprenylcysteine O-methyltransferase Ste14